MDASAAAGPRRGRGFRGRILWRLAVVGFVVLLLLLCGICLWAVATTNRAASETARLTSRNDAFQRARFALTTEKALQRQYYVQQGAGLRASFEQSAQSFTTVVRFVQLHGDRHDQALLEGLTADHRRYVKAAHRLFAAVDAGDQQRALRIDRQTEPLVQSMQTRVHEAADHERRETLAGLAMLRRRVVATTQIMLAAGGIGLTAVLAVLVAYHRRTERQAAQNQYLALHDTLTGLPNRTLLRSNLAGDPAQ